MNWLLTWWRYRDVSSMPEIGFSDADQNQPKGNNFYLPCFFNSKKAFFVTPKSKMDKTRSITRWRGRHPYQVYLVHGGRKSSAKTMMRPDVTMTRLLEHHVSPRMTNWNIPICDISGNTLVLSLPHTGYSELKFKILQCKKKCSMVVEINGFFIIKKKLWPY